MSQQIHLFIGGWSSHLQRDRQIFYIDLLVITVLSLLVFGPLLATLRAEDILYFSDGAWYVNRAVLIWQGQFDDGFVYQLAFPALIGLVNRIIQDQVVSAQLVNWGALYGTCLGTYLLGRTLYNRQVGWLAAVAIAFSPSLYFAGRLFWPFAIFIAYSIWLALLWWYVFRHPTVPGAVFLGAAIVLGNYIRLEGVAYIVLLIPIVWSIWQRTGSVWQALRFGLVSGGIVAAGFVPYLVLLAPSVPANNPATFALAKILTLAPPRWDLVARRFQESVALTLDHWPVWAWVIALLGPIWNETLRRRWWVLVGMILWNIGAIFLLAGWPLPRYLAHCLAFFAVLFGASLWYLTRNLRMGWIVQAVVLVFLTIPGLEYLSRLGTTPIQAYRQSTNAEWARSVDSRLISRGWKDTEIYTWCLDIVPFSRSRFHIIYRLYSPTEEDPHAWDSPTRLLKTLRETGKLFMLCDTSSIPFPDWKAYLYGNTSQSYSERLVLVEQVGPFKFYQAK